MRWSGCQRGSSAEPADSPRRLYRSPLARYSRARAPALRPPRRPDAQCSCSCSLHACPRAHRATCKATVLVLLPRTAYSWPSRRRRCRSDEARTSRKEKHQPREAAPARGPAALIASPARNGRIMLVGMDGFQPSPDELPPEPSSTGTQRKQWSNAEDALVRQLVQAHGTRSWTLVAQHLPGRTGKQCRERWHNHLDHDIRKDAWCARDRARRWGDGGVWRRGRRSDRVRARVQDAAGGPDAARAPPEIWQQVGRHRQVRTSAPTPPATLPPPRAPCVVCGVVARAHPNSTRASHMQVPPRPDRQRGEESLELCTPPRLEHRPRPRRRPSPERFPRGHTSAAGHWRWLTGECAAADQRAHAHRSREDQQSAEDEPAEHARSDDRLPRSRGRAAAL